jgi:hypothetical protein
VASSPAPWHIGTGGGLAEWREQGAHADGRHAAALQQPGTEQGGTEQQSKEGGRHRRAKQGGWRSDRWRAGWVGGRQPDTVAREVDWWSGGHRQSAGRHGSREGAEPPSKVVSTGAERHRGGRAAKQCGTTLGLAVGSDCSGARLLWVGRWAEKKTTLIVFSPNLRVGHGPPGPPYRSAPMVHNHT